MLGQRLRRWPNIKPAVVVGVIFSAYLIFEVSVICGATATVASVDEPSLVTEVSTVYITSGAVCSTPATT